MQSQLNDLSKTQIVNLIDEWIFNERDRAILKRRLLDGICYEPLSEEFNLSVQHIRMIVRNGKNKIIDRIK